MLHLIAKHEMALSEQESATRPPDVVNVGRYVVNGKLGRGAMGTVYRGEDPLIERTVALKVLSIDMETGGLTGFRERFFREAKSAGRLSHPNIVTIYDVGESDGTPYIAMEYLLGLTVRETLDSGVVLTVRKSIDIAMLVARGLDYAHQHGVIHRDIKPANIMLVRGGMVKIMDFGIALATDTSRTLSEGVLGSPRYMAPEQISGGAVDARTDIFALGVTLYEMLAGRDPFAGDNIPEVMHNVLHVPPPPPSTFNPDIPPELDMVVMRALAKDPGERFQRVKEMGRALVALRRLLRSQAEDPGATMPNLPPPVPPPRKDKDVAMTVRYAGGTSVSYTSDSSMGDIAQSRAETRQRLWVGAVLALAVGLIVLGAWLRDDTSLPPAAEAADVSPAPGVALPPPAVAPATLPAQDTLSAGEAVVTDLPDTAAAPAGEPPVVAPATVPAGEPQQAGAAVEVPAVATVEPAPPVERAPAAEEEKAAQGSGTVMLAVSPWGEVRVDGKVRGVTPPLRALKLSAGKHRIEIRNADLPPYVVNITLEAGTTQRITHRFD